MRGGDNCQRCATKCALVETETRHAILHLAISIRDRKCPRLIIRHALSVSFFLLLFGCDVRLQHRPCLDGSGAARWFQRPSSTITAFNFLSVSKWSAASTAFIDLRPGVFSLLFFYRHLYEFTVLGIGTRWI